MAAWQAAKADLEAQECSILVVSTDTKEQSQGVADRGLSYPIAYGVSKEETETIGSWWSDDHDGYVQPSEFLIGRGGVVLGAMYASGPVGRMGADEAIRMITRRETMRREQEKAST